MKTCTYEHCRSKNNRHYGKGLCKPCWMRLRIRGTLEYATSPYAWKSDTKTCTVTDCGDPYHALGYCKRHYRAFKLYGDATALKPWGRTGCGFPSCDGRHWAKGLCRRHYMMRLDILRTTVRFPKLPRLNARPFVDFVRSLPGSQSRLAERMGMERRQLVRILTGETHTIQQADADRYCIALGIHPAILWPKEWVDGGAQDSPGSERVTIPVGSLDRVAS